MLKDRKYLILTCDVEAMPDCTDSNHVDRLIYGKVQGAPCPVGVGLMMDICDSLGKKMTFFLDVLERNSYGREIDRVAQLIDRRGHDLELHIHAEFALKKFWEDKGYNAPTWSLNYFDEDSANILLDHSLKLFKDMVGFLPCAYRAGAFRYNQFWLKALKSRNIPLSFQYNPVSTIKTSYPHGPDGGILPIFRWSNGIIEVPTGCLENAAPRNGVARYEDFQSQCMDNTLKYQEFMERYWAYGSEHNVLVMVLHSWSFLRRDDAGYYYWHNDDYINAFYEFLEQLPANVQVITARDFLDKISCGEIITHFDVPLPFAGPESYPIFSL